MAPSVCVCVCVCVRVCVCTCLTSAQLSANWYAMLKSSIQEQFQLPSDCCLRPLQLNVLFLGPHRPFVFQFCFENVNLGHVTFGSRDLTAVPCAMAALLSTFCWPSVTIKCGTQVLVRRKVVKAECEDTFGEVLERVDPSFVGNSVVRVVTSKNERFLDPIHEVPLNPPIILSEQYGNNVCYYLLIRDAIYTEKERNFQTVHAICMFCRSEGKQEFTRHPLNAPKRRKT